MQNQGATLGEVLRVQSWHPGKPLVWSGDCLTWGLFPGLQNVPAPSWALCKRASTQPANAGHEQTWSLSITQCSSRREHSSSTKWLPQHTWHEKELELKVFGGFGETHKALFHQIPLFFFFFFHLKAFFFPIWECYAWNVQIPLICSLAYSLKFLLQLLSPTADFANQLSLHMPGFSLWENLSSGILFSRDAWSFQHPQLYTLKQLNLFLFQPFVVHSTC